MVTDELTWRNRKTRRLLGVEYKQSVLSVLSIEKVTASCHGFPGICG